MAVGEYLPPVITRLSMDNGDFLAKIAEAKAALKGLGGDAVIKVSTSGIPASLAQIQALKAALKDLGGTVRIGTDGALGSMAAQAARLKAPLKDAEAETQRLGTISVQSYLAGRTALDAYKASLDSLRNDLYVAASDATAFMGAMAGAGGGGKGGTAAAAAAGAAAGGAGFRLWGWLTPNVLHWIIAGGAEILAVVVPAMVALGAAAAVAAQGYQNVQQHMQSVYTASEATANMFHTTAGQLVGMGNALQKAQDAANPSVYGVLGSAVITVNEHFGNLAQTGLQVTRIFQTFAARVATDFAPGGALGSQVDALLSHMVQDLTQLGQVFGNLGHAVLAFASQMPGLAEVLLGSLAGLLGLASAAIQFAAKIQVAGVSVLTLAMGFEEFNRWGGLVATTLTKMGLASASLTGGPFSFARMGSVIQGLLSVFPTLIAYLARAAAAIGADGMAKGLTGFATGLAGVIEKLTPFQAALVLAAGVGLGVMIYNLSKARSATQQFTDSLQQAVMQASNMNAQTVAINNLAAVTNKLSNAKQILASASNVQFASTAQEMRSMANAQRTIDQLNQGYQQQTQDIQNTVQGANYLAHTYGTTLVGALALADLANVKLANGILGSGQDATVARMQIASLVQGYESMGQPLSAVGSDMTALAIQSGLANTQVSKLNQAWDQFMQNLTGGTAGLAQVIQGMSNLGVVVGGVGGNALTKAKGISLSIQQFASSLKGFSTNSAQAWQNFDQIVGQTAPQLIDWLRTAGAEGALSGDQFTKAVLGMVGSMTQLAAESPTAQAELLGLVQEVDPNIQTWGQLTTKLKQTHASLTDTTNAVESATKQMGDMSQIAQNLGTVLQSALLTALSAAKIAASGAGGAMQQYEQDIMNAGTSAARTAADRAALIGDLEKLGYTAKQAAALVDMVAGSINQLHSKSVTVTVVTQQVSVGGQQLGHAGAPGHAKGTPSAPPGWAWVGEAGPELVKFRGGEQVLPHNVSTGFADGAYDPGVNHIHVHLDGREIMSSIQKRAVATQRRTGHNGLSKRTR